MGEGRMRTLPYFSIFRKTCCEAGESERRRRIGAERRIWPLDVSRRRVGCAFRLLVPSRNCARHRRARRQAKANAQHSAVSSRFAVADAKLDGGGAAWPVAVRDLRVCGRKRSGIIGCWQRRLAASFQIWPNGFFARAQMA